MRLKSLGCRELLGFLVCITLVAFLTKTRATADEPKPADPSASEILDRMAKVYSNCKSYRDSGVVKTLFITRKSKWTNEKPFTTAFVRPNQFRFEFKQGPSDKADRYIIWSNGKDVRTWWDLGRRLKKPESLDYALGVAMGVSARSSKTIPSLLMPEMDFETRLTDIDGAKRTGNAKLGEVDCFRIDGIYAEDPITVWIDRETYLVRQIDEKRVVNGVQTERTTTYDPSIDGPITDKMLAFDAPVDI